MTRCTTCPYCGVGCGLEATPQPDGGVALFAELLHWLALRGDFDRRRWQSLTA